MGQFEALALKGTEGHPVVVDVADCRVVRRRPNTATALAIAVLGAVAACSSSSATTSSPAPSATQSSTSTDTSLRPTSWTISIDIVVSTPDGAPPFDLQVDSPLVLSDLTQPTTLTMRATAATPVLVVFNATVFTARLHGVGTLDVIGPVCPLSYSFVEGTDCAADPAVLPIGVTYADVAGPKPTGPAITSTAIRLVLLTAALQSGTYHLADSGSWRSASDTSPELHPVAITIDFTVTGPT